MSNKKLESVMFDRVKPIVEHAMQTFLGVSINELNHDITEKLKKSPLLNIKPDLSLPYKEAKKKFKKEFLKKLLRAHYGNISEVAKIADIDRRSIHRLINETQLDAKAIRQELPKPYQVKHDAVAGIIEDVVDSYKAVIHPDVVEQVYGHVDQVSENILKDLPEQKVTMKDAELEFDKAYLKRALKRNTYSITKTAKAIGLRYETLHRKLKGLGIK
jgi:DNA-binding NtrC family response regulator